MSKNKRKRRLKEEDFKKKKLKVGKKLPMPDNVTRTSFKARSIHIAQQDLKDDKFVKGSDKLTSLLNACSHYNAQARKDALLRVKELLQNNPGILKENLSAILQRILGLITDLENSVRKTFLALMSVIFKAVSETEILPFFGNIVAYLCLAMTHLNENIRLDSMIFLDVCLTFFPQLVKTNPKNIILNFISAISVEKSNVAKNESLLLRPEMKAKVMGKKVQQEVLSRLNHLLWVVFSETSSENDERCLTGEYVISSNHNPTLLSKFSLKTISTEFDSLTSTEEWLFELVKSLAPVLFEYWVECCPAEFSTNLVPIKTMSLSLQIMKHILEIFVTLIKSSKKNNLVNGFFTSNLSIQFNMHFTKVFPLSFTLQQSAKKKSAKGETIMTDIQLNILIAQLLCSNFYAIENSNVLPRWATEVQKYLMEVLAVKTTNRLPKLMASDIKSVTSLVKVFLLKLPNQFVGEKVQLLKSMYHVFKCFYMATNSKKILLEFVLEILKDVKSPMLSILDEWVTSLLTILLTDNCQECKCEIFLVCKSGILQQFPQLTKTMIEALPRLFSVVNFSNLSEKVQKVVIEILYHCKQVPSRQLYVVLARLCSSGNLVVPVLRYLLFVVYQLVNSNEENFLVSTFADYLSFLLSITTGFTWEDLERMNMNSKEIPNCYAFGQIGQKFAIIANIEGNNANAITAERWNYLNEVMETICQLLGQSDYSSRFLEMLETPLLDLLTKCTTLPLQVVYRLLYLVKTLLDLAKESASIDSHNEFLAIIGKWCAGLCLFLLKIREEFGKAIFLQILTCQLKATILELCKLSESVLTSMLCSFVSSADFDVTLTCLLLIDTVRELQGRFTHAHQVLLSNLYKKMEDASEEKLLDKQTFSDLKYQYKASVEKFA